MKKEREEVMEKRRKKLVNIIYKIYRHNIIVLKNDLEKWNLITNLIGLKEIKEKDSKENKERNKTKDKKKKFKKNKTNKDEE